MKYTSAEAAKLLRQLSEDQNAVLLKEANSCDFVAAVGEDIETVRPEYSYKEIQQKLAEYESKIRELKHAINVFNTTHTVPGFDMTIDAMLVYIPQLSNRKHKLSQMRNRLPKVRENTHGRNTNIIDYRYANYDIAEAEADYAETAALLAKAQTALDKVNSEIADIEISF